MNDKGRDSIGNADPITRGETEAEREADALLRAINSCERWEWKSAADQLGQLADRTGLEHYANVAEAMDAIIRAAPETPGTAAPRQSHG